MDKVYFLFDEEDAYESGYGIISGPDRSEMNGYYYCPYIIERTHSDYNKYFGFRKAKMESGFSNETISLFRIDLWKPEYYIADPIMTKEERDLMIKILNYPSSGSDINGNKKHYDTTWDHILNDVAEWSDLDIKDVYHKMPDYSLLPVID